MISDGLKSSIIVLFPRRGFPKLVAPGSKHATADYEQNRPAAAQRTLIKTTMTTAGESRLGYRIEEEKIIISKGKRGGGKCLWDKNISHAYTWTGTHTVTRRQVLKHWV